MTRCNRCRAEYSSGAGYGGMDYCISCYVHIQQEEEKKRHEQEMKQRRLVEDERKKTEKEYKEKERKAQMQKREALSKENDNRQARQGGSFAGAKGHVGAQYGRNPYGQNQPVQTPQPVRFRHERTSSTSGYSHGNSFENAVAGAAPPYARINLVGKKAEPDKMQKKKAKQKDEWKNPIKSANKPSLENTENEADYGKAASSWLKKRMDADKNEKKARLKSKMKDKRNKKYYLENHEDEEEDEGAESGETKASGQSALPMSQAKPTMPKDDWENASPMKGVGRPAKEEEDEKTVRRKIGAEVGRFHREDEKTDESQLQLNDEESLLLINASCKDDFFVCKAKSNKIEFNGKNQSGRKVTVEMKVFITDSENAKFACKINPRQHTFMIGETWKFETEFDFPAKSKGRLTLLAQLAENAIYIDRAALQSNRIALRLELEKSG